MGTIIPTIGNVNGIYRQSLKDEREHRRNIQMGQIKLIENMMIE